MSSLPSWKGAKRIAFDIETCDPQLMKLGPGVRRDGRMIGYSFAIEDGPCHYVPFGHADDNVSKEAALSYLRDQAAGTAGVEIVGANLLYDLDYAAEEGITFEGEAIDVLNAAPLIYEHHKSYSLDNVALRLGFAGKDELLLREAAANLGVDPKAELYKLPARYVGAYAEEDARLPLAVWAKQRAQLDEQLLWKAFKVETQLLPVLLRMRRLGVKINQDRLQQIEDWTTTEQARAIKIIKGHSGRELAFGDLFKASVLEPILEPIFGKLPRTPSTNKPQVKSEWLKGQKHPVTDAILMGRQMAKLRDTFVKGVRSHMTNGRLHCTINQLRRTKDSGDPAGAISGRVSSTNPNLQNQPIRNLMYGFAWRGIYAPDSGGKWYCCDYSQQEPRLVVHYSELLGLPGAKEAGNRYRDDPTTDYHDMMAELTGLPRSDAKTIFLGMSYGMGGAKLCHSLDLPTRMKIIRGMERMVAGERGQSIIDQFRNAVPFVHLLSKAAMRKAERAGFIITILGHRGHFIPSDQGGYIKTHSAGNKLIQGSAAYQMKQAMIDVDKEFPIQLQVHDELDMSLESPEQGERVAEIMRNAIPLSVPSKVDVEYGPSWGEINEKGRSACRTFYMG